MRVGKVHSTGDEDRVVPARTVVLLGSFMLVVCTVLPWADGRGRAAPVFGASGGGATTGILWWQISGSAWTAAAVVVVVATVGVAAALWSPNWWLARGGLAVALVVEATAAASYVQFQVEARGVRPGGVTSTVGELDVVFSVVGMVGLVVWAATNPSSRQPWTAVPVRGSGAGPTRPTEAATTWPAVLGPVAAIAVRSDPVLTMAPADGFTYPGLGPSGRFGDTGDPGPALPPFRGGPVAAAAFTSDEPVRALVGLRPRGPDSPASGWYPDYADPQRERFFDGIAWTEHTAAR
jgi:hypothetical protein